MKINQVIEHKAFNRAFISVEIFGAGNASRLANIKNGTRKMTGTDAEKMKNYFKNNFNINLEM